MKFQHWIFISLVLLSILQWVHFYPLLPDRIALQFDAHGNPANWSLKLQVLWILVCAETLVLLIFGLLPAFAHRIPVSLWNLPNRDYWFAGERKDQTILTLKDKLSWLGIFVLLFIIITNQSVINFNISELYRIPLPDMFYVTILFSALMGIWTLKLLRQFRR
ncbi:DUF1648 domain-containing protein [candidate division KSB1 bacterium]|nr:DUF1648 domain-containing protein [candidate division KSB1 bacterium]